MFTCCNFLASNEPASQPVRTRSRLKPERAGGVSSRAARSQRAHPTGTATTTTTTTGLENDALDEPRQASSMSRERGGGGAAARFQASHKPGAPIAPASSALRRKWRSSPHICHRQCARELMAPDWRVSIESAILLAAAARRRASGRVSDRVSDRADWRVGSLRRPIVTWLFFILIYCHTRSAPSRLVGPKMI